MKKIITILVIVALLVVVFVVKKSKPQGNISANSAGVVLLNPSDVVTVKYGNVDDVIPFTGDLSPLKQTIISAEVDAQVRNVLVQEGQKVVQGQLLAILDDTELKQTVTKQLALLDSAKAQLTLDQQKMNKNKELFDEGFISKIAYDELVNNYTNSRELVNQQAALLKTANKQLSDAMIKAPFAGVIYKKSIEPGQLASKNSQLFSLADLSVLEIKSYIPGDEINLVKLNQVVGFQVETDDHVYQGKIARINPVAQDGTRSYLIYIEFDNHEYNLKAGQFVKGQIVLRSLNDVLFVPTDSIHIDNNKKSYVLELNSGVINLKFVDVLLNNRLLNLTSIKGVESGTQIIGGNVLSVKVGDKIKIVY